jgi:hypothetical protein
MTFGTSLRANGLRIGCKRLSFSLCSRKGIRCDDYHPVLVQLLALLFLTPFKSEPVNLVRNTKCCDNRS